MPVIKNNMQFPWLKKSGQSAEYASLNQETASSSGDSYHDEKAFPDEKGFFAPPAPRHTDRIWKVAVVILLILTNLATFWTSFHSKVSTDDGDAHVPDSWARVDTLPTTYERLNWWTEYSDANETNSDRLWEEILPSHGFIAMDRQWAKERHWPDSMHLPSDPSKNVYLLEAYHLLHCVGIIHKTFWQAIRREDKYTYNPPHAGHCIDMMRQYVMCKADNTPLYIFGDDTAGDEQYRKCNNWNTLRQFATDHSACYRDTPLDVDPDTFPLGAHFGYCDDGDDHVTLGARRGNWEHGAVFDGPR